MEPLGVNINISREQKLASRGFINWYLHCKIDSFSNYRINNTNYLTENFLKKIHLNQCSNLLRYNNETFINIRLNVRASLRPRAFYIVTSSSPGLTQ